jgi:hypothetical protein
MKTATPTVIAVLDNQNAGAMVYWQLSGTVDPVRLSDAWMAAGLSSKLLPDLPTQREALKRAVNELREQRLLARPLPNGTGYSLVQESGEGDRLEYAQQITAQLDPGGELKLTPPEHSLASRVRAAYEIQAKQLLAIDISGMLLHLMDALKAVSLRQCGGFYFVPPDGVDVYRLAAEVVRSCTCCVCYEIPAMRSDSAVRAILAAIEHEALLEADSLEKVLDDGEAGPRRLRTKAAHCEAVEAKIASYEALLGTAMTALHEKLQRLRSGLTEAAMAAETAAEAA